jgi:hypothetical protein
MVVGTTTDEVGRAPMDFYSWGHVDMGIATFLLLSLINTIPSFVTGTLIYIVPYWLFILLVLLVAMVWELIENTLFVDLGIKFENRRDSFINALADIMFVMIGGFVMWILKGILVNIFGVENIPLFYIIGAVSFIIVLICFFIGNYITDRITKFKLR